MNYTGRGMVHIQYKTLVRVFVVFLCLLLLLVACKQLDLGLSAPSAKPSQQESLESYAEATTDSGIFGNYLIGAPFELGKQNYYGNTPSKSAAVESAVNRVIEEVGPSRVFATMSAGEIVLRTDLGAELRLETSSVMTWEQATELLQAVRGFLSHHYPKMESMKITAAIIRGALKELDPNGSFLTKEDMDVRSVSGKRFSGVGIVLFDRDDKVIVARPIEGGPAYRAGILPGDVILAVDRVPVTEVYSITSIIRGPVGSPVELTVLHAGANQPVPVRIIRGTIPLSSPVEVRELESGYLHVRITAFQEQTATDLEHVLNRYVAHTWIKGVVLDVRDCTFGALHFNSKVAGVFMSGGLLARTRKTVNAAPEDIPVVAGSGSHSMPMIVLVNSRSGWGSEYLAGAMQDRGRALVMGTRTIGGGALVREFEFGPEAHLRLTDVMVFTPSMRAIDKVGIVPDCIVRVRFKDASGQVLEEPQTADANGRPEFVVDSSPDHDGMVPLALNVLKRGRSPNVGKLLLAARSISEKPLTTFTESFPVVASPQSTAATKPAAIKPTLWVLSVGVSQYADSRQNLRFADDDARALAAALGRLGGDIYREVKTRVLTDHDATRENIINAMTGFLGQAAKDDIVLIFVAGHGVRYSPTGSYYFLTHDAGFDTMISRALKWSDFQEMITILSGNTNKIILALDTCHAGAIEVGMRSGGVGEDLAATMKEASGIYTIGASKPGEQSLESDSFSLDDTEGHGIFTYSLIRAMSGEANYDKDGYISLMVFSYVSREVPRLSGGKQHPYAKMAGTDLPLVRAPDK